MIQQRNGVTRPLVLAAGVLITILIMIVIVNLRTDEVNAAVKDTYDGITYEITDDNVLRLGEYGETQTMDIKNRTVESWPWHSVRGDLTRIEFLGDIKARGELECMFTDCRKVTVISGLDKLDTTGAAAYSPYIFRNCENLVSVNTANFFRNTAPNSNWGEAFINCKRLKEIDTTGWDFSNHWNFNGMFQGCSSLERIDVSKFDCRNISSAERMFSGCKMLETIDISSWETPNLTTMGAMFNGCEALTGLDVSNLDTRKVTNMGNLFNECKNLTELNFGENFSTANATSLRYLFRYCEKLEKITFANPEKINSSNAEDVSSLFSMCEALPQETIQEIVKGLDIKKAKDISGMFWGLKQLTELDIRHFTTATPSVLESMTGLFYECENLEDLKMNNSLDTSKVIYMSSMFRGCKKLPQEAIQGVVSNFDTKNVKDMRYLFKDCEQLSRLDISNFETGKGDENYLELIGGMFEGCKQLKNIVYPDPAKFDTSKCTNISVMWNGCESLETIDTTWLDTSSNELFNGVFNGCRNLKEIIGLDKLDTSAATNMANMFSNMPLTKVDVSNFDTSNVERMDGMFADSEKLVEITGLENWNTEKVKTMRGMFRGCEALEGLDISGFNTSNVTTLEDIFEDCKALADDKILAIDITGNKLTNANDMYKGCDALSDRLKAQMGAAYAGEFPQKVKEKIDDAAAKIDKVVQDGGSITPGELAALRNVVGEAKASVQETLPGLVSDANTKADESKKAAEEAEKKNPGSAAALTAAKQAKTDAAYAVKMAEALLSVAEANKSMADTDVAKYNAALESAKKKRDAAQAEFDRLSAPGSGATAEEIQAARKALSEANEKVNELQSKLSQAQAAANNANTAVETATITVTETKTVVETVEKLVEKVTEENNIAEKKVVVNKTYKVAKNSFKVNSVATAKKKGIVTFTKAKNAKNITVPKTVKLRDGRVYVVKTVGKKAFTAKKIRKVTVGANVTKLAKQTFAKSKAKTLVLKTKKLKKASVKGSLKGSKITKIKVSVGSKKQNNTYVKKYKKIFTKKNCGKKVKVAR